MKEVLLGMLEKQRGFLEAIYDSEDSEHLPGYLIEGEDDKLTMLSCMITDESSKTFALLAAVQTALLDNAKSFIWTMEGWTLPAELMDMYQPGDVFQEDPERIEMLSVIAGTRDGSLALQSAEIQRGGGKCTLVWGRPSFRGDEGVIARSRFDIFTLGDKIPVGTWSEFYELTAKRFGGDFKGMGEKRADS